MSHLVHVGLDAAHKERVGGAECGHQGVQRVLEHRRNRDEQQEQSEELGTLNTENTHTMQCLHNMNDQSKKKNVKWANEAVC